MGRAFPRIYNGQKALGASTELRLPNPAPPPNPFDSNHNYIMYGGGKPIGGLIVTIEIHEDLVAPDAMSMQLNCYSPGPNTVYQQFVTGMSSLAKSKNLLIGSSIENFPSTAYRAHLAKSVGLRVKEGKDNGQLKGDLFNQHFHFGSFDVPSGRIPAGWKLKWELYNDLRILNGAIIGAQYTVIPLKGKAQTSGPQLIRSFKFEGTNKLVTDDALAPILAFEMNMVGTNGGQFKRVKAGAGTITYQATTNLTPRGTLPAGLGSRAHTAETSTIRYAELLAVSTTKIVQKFRAVN